MSETNVFDADHQSEIRIPKSKAPRFATNLFDLCLKKQVCTAFAYPSAP
jgi:hypothetical protein